ncbi:Ycf66 family protein [Kovacikia minuta CCNUW1]|uniref:Ycf66 family protein n=1 Tax=Kovacikia minuta TaxID=2931930 RepID=UPI001CC99A96|nr:Ycf66 family protein [Kovacikia minuta]UBF29141.1 Ycf66 family protein [Kovacikia minuta CCNUW1]
MVNIGLNLGSLLGILLAVAGAALYFLRSQRPALARDHDIFFAAVALLSGGILFFQGWRLDPILQFLQVLLAGSAMFYAYDGIRLRGVATQQAKRNSPIVDDDRPVSRVYRAELDELNPYEDRPVRRRIPGTREARPNRDEFEEGGSRRPSSRINGEERLGPGDRSSRRKPRSRPERDPSGYSEGIDDIDIREDRPGRSRSNSARSGNSSPSSSRSRRPRPPIEESEIPPRRSRNADIETSSAEYVDYRPVDDEDDNWGNY